MAAPSVVGRESLRFVPFCGDAFMLPLMDEELCNDRRITEISSQHI